ncbi:enoyl-CoA hydratase/isomerase family protein [Acidiferrimicrobium sp. IK]|uniref:enoyl-CoA hydratase/isomerase family protein n=1 Tax=Acidiferrimicrobium sp. IK TaxID=2871700 RepID=UPI0021CB64B5|nr:enoyl-CoA hydratase/isomerase family protein [Acidiferrimicrobium sp. IK]MCU4184440.1 enoyl-CoA hydratase/isomerase family protein [Acidiferrimicrobium sp. IK]
MTTNIDAWDKAGLRYEVADGVAWLRLNRPDRRNAMDHYPGGHGPDGMGLRDALLAAIHDASEDKGVKAAVITGVGTTFCAGADLRQPGGFFEIPADRIRTATAGRDDGILYGWYRLFEAIWRSDTPFIAAVNGPAVGGGCQLALACDLIYASENATFWEIFGRIGLPLEGGAAWLLTRSLSLPLAKEMALLGEPLPARQAEAWRLINRCVPSEELEATVAEVASRLATLGPPGRGPAAGTPARDLSGRVGHIKGQLNAAWEQTMWQTFREEASLLSMPAGDPPPGS